MSAHLRSVIQGLTRSLYTARAAVGSECMKFLDNVSTVTSNSELMNIGPAATGEIEELTQSSFERAKVEVKVDQPNHDELENEKRHLLVKQKEFERQQGEQRELNLLSIKTASESDCPVNKTEISVPLHAPMTWEANGVSLAAGKCMTILIPLLASPSASSLDRGTLNWTIYSESVQFVTLTLGDSAVGSGGAVLTLVSLPALQSVGGLPTVAGTFVVGQQTRATAAALLLKLNNR